MLDLTEVGFVARLTIGSVDPAQVQSAAAAEATMDLLNRCLSEAPKGHIVGIEKTFTVFNIGENQVVLQALIYHVGFKRKPLWYDEAIDYKESVANARPQ